MGDKTFSFTVKLYGHLQPGTNLIDSGTLQYAWFFSRDMPSVWYSGDIGKTLEGSGVRIYLPFQSI